MSTITITKSDDRTYPLDITDLEDGQIYEEKDGSLYVGCNVSITGGKRTLLAFGISSAIEVYDTMDGDEPLRFRNIDVEIVVKN